MNKLEKTIIWILEAARERKIKDLSKFQIHKLVYLIDVESRKYNGESFFGREVNFQREKLGPISVQVYDALASLTQRNLVQKEVSNGSGYTAQRHSYSLTDKVKLRDFELSDGEMAFIGSVLGDYVGLRQSDLRKVAYSTEPMKILTSQEAKKGKSLEGVTLEMDSVPLDEELIKIISE